MAIIFKLLLLFIKEVLTSMSFASREKKKNKQKDICLNTI